LAGTGRRLRKKGIEDTAAGTKTRTTNPHRDDDVSEREKKGKSMKHAGTRTRATNTHHHHQFTDMVMTTMAMTSLI